MIRAHFLEVCDMLQFFDAVNHLHMGGSSSGVSESVGAV